MTKIERLLTASIDLAKAKNGKRIWFMPVLHLGTYWSVAIEERFIPESMSDQVYVSREIANLECQRLNLERERNEVKARQCLGDLGYL